MRSVLLGPLWTTQLLTSAKSFTDNPLIGSRWLNARGLHLWRLRTAEALAAMRRRRLAALIPAEDRAAFDRDGFIVKPQFLPQPQFAALLEQVRKYRGAAREQLQGDAVTRRIACDHATLTAMPALAILLADPRWRGLINYVGSFDAEPMVYMQTILSHAGCAGEDPQEALHSDTFHATVKAWLYLTDVEAGGACFNYVPGSHRLTRRRLAWERRQSLAWVSHDDRYSREGSLRVTPAQLRAMGLPPPREFAVPANTLIVADTHGFHARGASVRPVKRVEIWAYGRRNPFLPATGLDLFRLAALRDRRIGLFWWSGDLLERLGIKSQVWKPCPDRSAFDPSAPPVAARAD
ncbi:MAG: phytanoyl-CoA dioxygenase family protein [Steroidobacteraceae bacterium]